MAKNHNADDLAYSAFHQCAYEGPYAASSKKPMG
jgi:hypothetical protein